jgi:S1-C subfamily serine protease
MIESLLLTTARVSTFFGAQLLTGASGFFFERDERLYLVTNRHVVIDKPSGHLPDRIEIEVHTDAALKHGRASPVFTWPTAVG